MPLWKGSLLPGSGSPHILSKNRLYGFKGSTIVFSDDGWHTTKAIPVVLGVGNEYRAGAPYTMRATDSGALLVSLSTYFQEDYGNLFRITHLGFAPVLSTATGRIYRWGIDSYGSVIVAGVYGVKGEARHVYKSNDDGQTWSEIWRVPYDMRTDVHIHGVGYDHYTGSVWACHGDTTGRIFRLDAPNYGVVRVTGENLGIATGASQTLSFGHDKVYREEADHTPGSVAPVIYANGTPINSASYTINYVSGSVALTATAGAVITADYTYNAGVVITGTGVSTLSQPTTVKATANYVLFGQDNKANGVLRYNKTTGVLDQPLNLTGTPYDAPIFSPFIENDGYVYFATSPTTHDEGVKASVWRAQAPYSNWELIHEIDTFNSGITGVYKLAGFIDGGLVMEVFRYGDDYKRHQGYVIRPDFRYNRS